MEDLRRRMLRNDAGRALWICLAAVWTLIQLPLWLIRNIPPSLRPHPEWTYEQAIKLHLAKAYLWHICSIQLPTRLSLDPGPEGGRFIVIQPAAQDRYQGVCRVPDGDGDTPKIIPGPVGATWYPSRYRPGDEETRIIVLHLHGGGAYVLGDGRPSDVGFAADLLVRHCHAKLLCPSYRLARNPDGHFPAALQDALTSYQYLLSLGIPPERIVLSGDSAGGNLALALLRYLEDHAGESFSPSSEVPSPPPYFRSSSTSSTSSYFSSASSSSSTASISERSNFSSHSKSSSITTLSADPAILFPTPAATLLWSPMVDIATACDPSSVDNNPRQETDYLVGRFGEWGARSLVPKYLPAAHPYLSPVRHPFSTKSPIWVQAGAGETMYEAILHFAYGMEHVPGNIVEVHVQPHAPHNILLAGSRIGWGTEAEECAIRANEFLLATSRGDSFPRDI